MLPSLCYALVFRLNAIRVFAVAAGCIAGRGGRSAFLVLAAGGLLHCGRRRDWFSVRRYFVLIRRLVGAAFEQIADLRTESLG